MTSGDLTRLGLAPLATLLLSVLLVAPAAAQRPAELTGRALGSDGIPIEGASLELIESGMRALSDASGRYRFRSVSAGRYLLLVHRIGYLERTLPVELKQGVTQNLDIELTPAPVSLQGLSVVVAGAASGGVRVGREQIARSGARSAADLLRSFPVVVVRSTTAGGPETVSVRGGAPDAVLVLVDGVALNDPVTGEADLSTIPAQAIESLILLPGGQSARYGPRAQAGVILIETRTENVERALRGAAGSLGSWTGGASWGASRPLQWSAGVDWSSLDGSFDFDLPAEVGGGEGTRANADAHAVTGWAAASQRLAGGALRLRAAGETLRRGMPGRSYAPSQQARQSLERLQATAAWRRADERTSLELSAAGARQVVRFRDRGPPFGLPYDDTARISGVDVRGQVERSRSSGAGLEYGAGIELRRQWIQVTSLSAGAPTSRTEIGAFGQGGFAADVAGKRLAATAGARLDHDAASGWTFSRSLVLSASGGDLQTHAALRSSYSPPALADQYFRAGVGVEPNPELAAERVPWELELAVRGERSLGALRGNLDVSAYRGDVRGMIIWAPDYRFIWSPRNVDVNRLGLEARAGAETLDERIRVTFAHAYTRTVYDRPPPDDGVQVVYRPRHTSTIDFDGHAPPWRLQLAARFTGARHTVPAPVNVLPSFWISSGGVSRAWHARGWTISTALRAERLFDEKGSLIFGFPEPGRTARLEVTIRLPHTNPSPAETDRR